MGTLPRRQVISVDGDKEKLMLFDENVVDLNKFMTMKRTDSLFDIIA